MQDTENIEIELTQALYKLKDSVLKKKEEVEILENKLTNLNIENIDLKNEISILKNSKAALEKEKSLVDMEIKKNKKALLDNEASKDIDISISQLKNILGKN
jgi:hypothetical protein